MKKSFLIAGALTMAMAVPAVAAMQGRGPGPMPDMTRADVEARVKAHFEMVDANKDGAITQDEIKARRDAMRASRMDARFKAMDKDGDGSISRAEFDEAHADRGPRGDRPMMGTGKQGMMGAGDRGPGKWGDGFHHRGDMMGGRMFTMADADKDGKVTLAEATNAALAHFDKMDANKDGTVTAQERMDYMKSVRDGWRGKVAQPDKPAS